jgi:hypothetical protein
MGQSRCGRWHSARRAAHGARKHQGRYRCDVQRGVPRHPDYLPAHHRRLLGLCRHAVARHFAQYRRWVGIDAVSASSSRCRPLPFCSNDSRIASWAFLGSRCRFSRTRA